MPLNCIFEFMNKVKIIECPRDAMQGIKTFIPTAHKVQYIQSLLRVGFDTIDFGSFVSPKAIPQMADTKEVLDKIIGYMEKKYISGPMKLAKEIILKNAN